MRARCSRSALWRMSDTAAPYAGEPASPPSPEAQGLPGEPVLHSPGSHLFIFAQRGKLSSASELTSVSISRLQPHWARGPSLEPDLKGSITTPGNHRWLKDNPRVRQQVTSYLLKWWSEDWKWTFWPEDGRMITALLQRAMSHPGTHRSPGLAHKRIPDQSE